MVHHKLPFWFDFHQGVQIQLSSFEPQFYSININELQVPDDMCEEMKTMIEQQVNYEWMLIQFYEQNHLIQ